MIVIRRDKKDLGKSKKKKSVIPFLGILTIFAILFLLIPLGLTLLLHLPWYLSFIYPVGTIIGVILIISGTYIVYMGIKGLRLRYSYEVIKKRML